MKNSTPQPDRQPTVSRRGLLTTAAGAVAAASLGISGSARAEDKAKPKRVAVKGNINHSVCSWCYNPMPLETLAQHAVAMGLKSIELVDPKDWPILKKYGLKCALANSHGFVKGFNDPENHAMCIDKITTAVDACAEAGFPTVITFSGFRNGIADDVGLKNTVAGLKKVIGYAEKKKINLCIEVLNSRVDTPMKGHPGYQCDSVEWAVEVCKQIGSPRMTLLFDIYHVQVMQGDIITRIRKYHEYVGHYHTAGCPGRNEIGDSQEINYPPIMKEIVKTGYKGYVGHEWIPTIDPVKSLSQGVAICDV